LVAVLSAFALLLPVGAGRTPAKAQHLSLCARFAAKGGIEMRDLVVSEFVTLDGVMEDPGGNEKSPYGGWSFQFWSDEAGKYKLDELFAADALLLGRKTYEGFAQAWRSRTDEAGFADRMNGLPKYVPSTTLSRLEWNNSQLIKGDLAPAVRKLKEESGQYILVAGSCELVRGLLRHDLVDELRLMVHPIVVGGGKRIFPDGIDRKTLDLADAKPLPAGVVVLTYKPKK